MVEATQSMRWVSALSKQPSLEAAVREVVAQAQQALETSPDLAIVFVSAAFGSEFSRLLPLLQEALSVPHLVGCSGGGVIGAAASGQTWEVEGEPSLSLMLAHLPGVQVRTFHVLGEDLPDLDSPPGQWTDLIGVDPADKPQFLLMGDPLTSGITDLLQGLDFAYPGLPKVGGLASLGSINGRSGLFCDRTRYEKGVVGVALSGDVIMDTIVAQGCRPIGEVYQVVEGERNILLALEGQDGDEVGLGSRTPLDVLQKLLTTLDENDRQLAQHSLFVGIAQNSFKQSLDRGDFLIRNLIGVDPKVGAIAIGDRVRPGQRIQFHLRDARTSAEDLEVLLQQYQQTSPGQPIDAAGAFMFSCMGRGEGLYKKPNFDSQLFHHYLPQAPLGGFFCNGEIGPVGGTTYLHGYTSVLGIVRQP